jgi:hypothetical protein
MMTGMPAATVAPSIRPSAMTERAISDRNSVG